MQDLESTRDKDRSLLPIFLTNVSRRVAFRKELGAALCIDTIDCTITRLSERAFPMCTSAVKAVLERTSDSFNLRKIITYG